MRFYKCLNCGDEGYRHHRLVYCPECGEELEPYYRDERPE